MARYWLFLSDPGRYHWDTLFVKGKEMWNGMKNSDALRYMKQVKKGDKVLCYHGAPDKLVYAMAEAASDSYLNPHDAAGKLLIVNLRAVQKLPRSVPYVELKTNRRLRRMKFLAKSRLAVSPLAEEEYAEILRMSGYVPPLGLSLLS